MFLVAKQQRSAAIHQQLLDLVRMKSGVEWNRGPSRGDDSQVGRHPPRMVRRQNRHSRIPRDACRKPVRPALRHPGQFGKRNPLHRLVPLNLKRNVVGKFPGRFLKPLVEGWHESEKILQENGKKALGRVRARFRTVEVGELGSHSGTRASLLVKSPTPLPPYLLESWG